MGRDFFPRQEVDIVAFTRNFKQQIAIAHAALGLSDEQVAHYAATQAVFEAKYSAALNPTTATRPARAAKSDALVALEAETRVLARIIRSNPAVTSDMRLALGMTPA